MFARIPQFAQTSDLRSLEDRVILLVTEPALWLCLGIFLNISGITDFFPALSGLESSVFAAGLATAGLRIWKQTKHSSAHRTPVICACGFGLLAASLLTSLYAGHNLSILEDSGWRHFAKFIILVTMGLAAYPCDKPHTWLISILEVSLAVLAMSVLYRFHVLEQFNFETGRMELAGRHGDPNFACLFMTIGMVLALQKFTESKSNYLRLAHATAVTLFLFTAWFTESRAGLAIMAVVALGAVLLFPFGKHRKHLLIAAPIITIACIALFGGRILDRYKSIDDASNSGRIAGIMATMDMVLEQPIFGHGYNSSSEYVGRYQDTLFTSNSVALEIHTTPFQIAGELGLIGLIAYGSLYGYTLLLATRTLKNAENLSNGSRATILIILAILFNMTSIPMAYIGTVHGITLIFFFKELTTDKVLMER